MSVSETGAALAPVAGLAVNCLTHIAVTRLGRGGPLGKIMIGFAVGLVVTAGLCVAALASMEIGAADAVALAALSLATYAALGFGYWSFVNLNMTSLRIRLLQEVQDSPGGLSAAEVGRRYGSEEMLRRRLERLLGNGQYTERAGRFFLGKRTFLCLARLNDFVRLLVLGRTPARPRRCS
jgi:hypothetical protein